MRAPTPRVSLLLNPYFFISYRKTSAAVRSFHWPLTHKSQHTFSKLRCMASGTCEHSHLAYPFLLDPVSLSASLKPPFLCLHLYVRSLLVMNDHSAAAVIDLGADVSQTSRNGTTSMMVAAEHGHVFAVRYLGREHGADIDRAWRRILAPRLCNLLRRTDI
jgi:hypothetical protein